MSPRAPKVEITRVQAIPRAVAFFISRHVVFAKSAYLSPNPMLTRPKHEKVCLPKLFSTVAPFLRQGLDLRTINLQ